MAYTSSRVKRPGRARSLLGPVCLLAMLVWPPAPVAAQEMALPLETQWGIFDNVLAFDRSFEERTEDGVVVGVLYQSRFRPSALARSEIVEMSRRSTLQLGGSDVRIVSIEVTSPAEVERRLLEEGVDIAYVTPLRGAAMSALARLSIEHRIVTLTGVPEYVDLGFSIGLDVRGGRPEILIQLDACRAQGGDLSSELLSIVTVLRDAP